MTAPASLAEFMQALTIAERLEAMRDELHVILGSMTTLFEDPDAVDARYCRHNLQEAALRLAFASNRITSPTENTRST